MGIDTNYSLLAYMPAALLPFGRPTSDFASPFGGGSFSPSQFFSPFMMPQTFGMNSGGFGDFSGGFGNPMFSSTPAFGGFGDFGDFGNFGNFSGFGDFGSVTSKHRKNTDVEIVDDTDKADYSAYKGSAAKLQQKWKKRAPHLSLKFFEKTMKVADRVKCDPQSLLAVMYRESSLSASIKNPRGSATGLIQFTESTARSLGTTTSHLKRMSETKQMDFVEKYLLKWKNQMRIPEDKRLSGGQVYTLVFTPGYSNRSVLAKKGSEYYRLNSGLDINNDGAITQKDLSKIVRKIANG